MSAPKILFHTCCAPCLVAPYNELINEGMDITVFWYNPNIHPYLEYKARFGSFLEFVARESIKSIVNDDYDLEGFLSVAQNEPIKRCNGCYRIRLEQTVKTAAEGGFGLFSTTLLYSRYQNQEEIVSIGKELALQYGIEFYDRDFRSLWNEGIKLSKEQGMYRQKYCGCIYSERDRYMGNK